MNQKVEISYKTIVFTVLFLVGVWVIYILREAVLQLVSALLIVAILNPTVSKLSALKIPRSLSVSVSYLIAISLLGLGIAGVVPVLIEQSASFATHLPQYIQAINIGFPVASEITQSLLSEVAKLPSEAVRFSVSLVSNILSVITVLIFAFYLLMAHNKLDSQLTLLIGGEGGKKVARIISNLESRLGGWARGQLLLMFSIGLASFLGLLILGIPYALPLAILAGILEIVPYFGPILSALPAVIIALSISPLMAAATIAMYFLIQQTENYLFVPKIMEKSVGISPIIILLALTVGFKLAGVMGVLLSIPLAITIEIITKEYLIKS